MALNGLDVKFFGIVENFARHGAIKCEETFAMWGQDVYGYKDILDNLGLQRGDTLRFGVHVNARGVPQVSVPAWKCDQRGEPINLNGAMFVKAEEVLRGNPNLMAAVKMDFEVRSRQGKGKRGPPSVLPGEKGGCGIPGKRQKGAPPLPAKGGKDSGKGNHGKGKLPEADQQAADVDQGMLQAITTTAKEPPLGSVIFKREYQISCDLPSDKVQYIVGIAGENLVQVQEQTGTRLQFEEVEGDLHRLEIQGPLLGLYQAHSIMMGRYHEAVAHDAAAEAEASGGKEGGDDGPEVQADDPGDMVEGGEGDDWPAGPPEDAFPPQERFEDAVGGPPPPLPDVQPIDTQAVKAQIRELKQKLREAGLVPLRSKGKGKGFGFDGKGGGKNGKGK